MENKKLEMIGEEEIANICGGENCHGGNGDPAHPKFNKDDHVNIKYHNFGNSTSRENIHGTITLVDTHRDGVYSWPTYNVEFDEALLVKGTWYYRGRNITEDQLELLDY